MKSGITDTVSSEALAQCLICIFTNCMLVLIASDKLNINTITFSASQSVHGERGTGRQQLTGVPRGSCLSTQSSLHTEPCPRGKPSHYTPASPRQHLNTLGTNKSILKLIKWFKNLFHLPSAKLRL